MGPVAEDALLAVAPSNDPEVCLSAIQLLAEVGTQKSVRPLRSAVQSRNPEVRTAAKAAIQSILRREKPAEQPQVASLPLRLRNVSSSGKSASPPNARERR